MVYIVNYRSQAILLAKVINSSANLDIVNYYDYG